MFHKSFHQLTVDCYYLFSLFAKQSAFSKQHKFANQVNKSRTMDINNAKQTSDKLNAHRKSLVWGKHKIIKRNMKQLIKHYKTKLFVQCRLIKMLRKQVERQKIIIDSYSNGKVEDGREKTSQEAFNCLETNAPEMHSNSTHVPEDPKVQQSTTASKKTTKEKQLPTIYLCELCNKSLSTKSILTVCFDLSY